MSCNASISSIFYSDNGENYISSSRYIYFEKAQLSGYNVLTVLYCAKKYMISRLEKACREFLEKKIDHTNVCFILEQVSSNYRYIFTIKKNQSLLQFWFAWYGVFDIA